MKQDIYALRGLRYKLWMICILISGPSYIYEDNTSVACITNKPELVLTKISNSVCHTVHESVVMGEFLV